MFDDPGAKLKLIAKIAFWLMIIACAITGFAIGAGEDAGLGFLLALAGAAVGVLLGWLSSITLYAFGELVDQIDLINKNLYTTTVLLEKKFADNEKKNGNLVSEAVSTAKPYTATNRWED